MATRIVLIILDSVGIGEVEDSHLYGDEGSNTLKNTAQAVGGLSLPNLENLGLGNIEDVMGVNPNYNAIGSYGKMKPKSSGKDTTTGHWELMDIVLEKPFPTYPNGFPSEIIDKFEKRIKRKTLGNVVASGTVIIEELGEEHIKTGFPIVYTSADSVFQIAAHEEIIPIEQLYSMCQTAREILQGEHGVGRVIARPFLGSPGSFFRTDNRQDYSLKPTESVLNKLKEANIKVIGVGKIEDIFVGRGIDQSYPIKNNADGIEKIIDLVKANTNNELIFANLIDFDQLYGHRNDPKGYAQALEEFDKSLEDILNRLKSDDILIITADHGCDPTTPSTDHSREYVPLLIYGEKLKANINIGTRDTFGDLGVTIADIFNVNYNSNNGKSFYSLIK
ncbi:Phosphopentomutase [Candidatus Syntrophocurvum alkaliphilum]|uniref:Phosphopentomutase n=1 Tax=Candidatus Syntrophocurvum alkaliphilum TaxID=2293317 RepID=A0A6I6DET0_9FIRM|nr:phosphopentomutase [Candidatus Syntrophocurvum alkaliphilum]QGT98991.1 Phosphopentomutase [Candidatus Syntrophocurvum alkaliphilum]